MEPPTEWEIDAGVGISCPMGGNDDDGVGIGAMTGLNLQTLVRVLNTG